MIKKIFAQEDTFDGTVDLPEGPEGLPSFPLDRYFNYFLELVMIVLAVAAFIGVVYSGVMMLTSGGDAAKFTAARKNLIWSIIGIVIAVLAWFLVSAVYSFNLCPDSPALLVPRPWCVSP